MRAYEISLTGVWAFGHHGVLPDERRDGQEFVVDAFLRVQRRPSDDLASTVNYAALAAALVADVARDPVDLIETLADRLAATCLRAPVAAGTVIEDVTVVVHKPGAPVGVPFGDVSVTVSRTPAVPVVLSLGSNQGDSAALLAEAVDRIARLDDVVEVTGVSPLYRTAPVGGVAQDDFLNLVVTLDAEVSAQPADLLRGVQRIEKKLGRVRDVRWGPRTLDIDIVAFGDEIAADPELTLPHPRAHERAFVLVPWLDLDPDAALPGHGRVADLVAGLDTGGVRRAGAAGRPEAGRA